MSTSTSNIAGSHDITARRGDTFTRTFEFQDADLNPIDLTGKTFKCEVRDMYDKKLILQFTPVIHDTNKVTITKSATQMNVRAGRYKFDLADVSEDSTDVDKVAGWFTIVDDVTSNVANPLEDDDSQPLIVG